MNSEMSFITSPHLPIGSKAKRQMMKFYISLHDVYRKLNLALKDTSNMVIINLPKVKRNKEYNQ